LWQICNKQIKNCLIQWQENIFYITSHENKENLKHNAKHDLSNPVLSLFFCGYSAVGAGDAAASPKLGKI